MPEPAGKGTEFDGSRYLEPIPGVALGCISPEASELLDRIMDEYRKHYEAGCKIHRPEHCGTSPDKVYRFAYWLVRWSGLVQPNERDRPCLNH